MGKQSGAAPLFLGSRSANRCCQRVIVGDQASNRTVNFLISLWETIKFNFFNLLETPTVTPLSLTDSRGLSLPDRAHGDIRK
jgi:hypothetical protein